MKKKHLQLLVGLVVSGLFIWLAFRAGNITLAEVGRAFARTNWWWGIPMVAVTMLSFWWRTLRWKLLLEPVRDVPTGRLFGPLMIGFGFNNIFPARAGEIARPYALSKQENIPFGAGLSTIIVERITDVLVLLLLLATLPLYTTLDPSITREMQLGDRTITFSSASLSAAMPTLSVMAGVLLVGVLSFLFPQVKGLYLGILRALPLIPEFIKAKLAGFIESFSAGVSCLRNPRVLALVSIHSLIVWISIAFTIHVMTWGFPDVKMHFGQSIAFLVVTCVVISIPSSPGFWGLYEFGGVVALTMMGVVPDTPEGASAAFAFTLVVHILQWVPTTAYGLWAAARLSISADNIPDAEQLPPPSSIELSEPNKAS
jgi:uncharacterized protein (TIRG00374 family)